MSRDSIMALAQKEPERTKLLLKVAGGGALALLLWTWAGKTFLNDVEFVLLNLVAIVGYAVAIVLFTGQLVRGADRWQVESAEQARRLLSKGRHAETVSADPGIATFDHWYFVLRLEEEIKRARRHGTPVAVVMMKVGKPGDEPSAAMTEQISFDMAQLATSHANTMTMPSAIGPLEYAFLLPDSDRKEAKGRITPLLAPLGDYWCDFGIAVYPDDGTDAEDLVEMAREQIKS